MEDYNIMEEKNRSKGPVSVLPMAAAAVAWMGRKVRQELSDTIMMTVPGSLVVRESSSPAEP